MKYLVTTSVVETALPRDDPKGMAKALGAVLASLEKCSRLQEEGKLTGGVPAGRRACAFVVEAESHKALVEFLDGLPMWLFHDVTVVPLQEFSDQIALDRAALEKVKAAGG